MCRLIDGPSKRCFKGEILPELKHLGAGMLGMTSGRAKSSASQFYITLAANLDVRHLCHLPAVSSGVLLFPPSKLPLRAAPVFNIDPSAES